MTRSAHTTTGSRLPTLDELAVEGRRVLLRADLNVPLGTDSTGRPVVADDARLRAALPTIEELRSRGASIVLISHLGRPKGHDAALSLRPVADRLAELTRAPVTLAPDVVGPEVEALAEHLGAGEILLLENVRYAAGETKNDSALAAGLADLADVYVDDAFATAHRAHASTVGVAELLPCAAGRLLERELSVLDGLLADPGRPLMAVLGGAKIADKLGVVERFLATADVLCVGGAMSLALLAAQGHRIGDSACTEDDRRHAEMSLRTAAAARCRLDLPDDLVIAHTASPADSRRTIDGVEVPDGWSALDIGPRTAARFAELVAGAATVFWNGPLGRFELPGFEAGTAAVARAVSATEATPVVGGGETVQALTRLGNPDRVTHLSTGGGAMLARLAGEPLPAVEALCGTPVIA